MPKINPVTDYEQGFQAGVQQLRADVEKLAEELGRPTEHRSHYRDGLHDAAARLRAILDAW